MVIHNDVVCDLLEDVRRRDKINLRIRRLMYFEAERGAGKIGMTKKDISPRRPVLDAGHYNFRRAGQQVRGERDGGETCE